MDMAWMQMTAEPQKHLKKTYLLYIYVQFMCIY